MGSLVGIPIVITLIIFIINTSAYLIPPLTSISHEGVTETPYFRLEKRASPPGPFDNSAVEGDGLEIEFIVTIKAKKTTLTNVVINDECRVFKENGAPNCPPPTVVFPLVVNEEILASKTYELTYKKKFDEKYKDSLVTDTVSITADAADEKGVTAFVSKTIKIGNPPETCPREWPVLPQGEETALSILQGPDGSFSHSGSEAIDIYATIGHTVTARHAGTVIASGWAGGAGNIVTIESSCNGTPFVSQYFHLSAIGVDVGSKVNFDEIIGLTGDTSSVPEWANPHLHYEFEFTSGARTGPKPNNPPYMGTDFIPIDVSYGCSGGCGQVTR